MTPPLAPAVTLLPISTTPVSLSLAQVMQAAQRNPDVMAAQRALQAARADVLTADRAPAPTLSAGVASIDLEKGLGKGSIWEKMLDKSLGLDWTWERGNKRALRTELAERLVKAAQADGQDALVMQQIGAQAAFYDLLASQQRLQAVQVMAQSAAQLAQSAERRLKAGDLSSQDATRTRIEAERARADVQSATLEHQQAAQILTLWTGLQTPTGGWQALAYWPDAQALSTPDDSAMHALVEQRPDVIAARARVEAAQSAVQAAQALRQVDPTVGTSFNHFPGTSTRLLAFRLSVPLTSGKRFDGEIGHAQAQEEQSRDLLQKTLLQVRAELNSQMQAWQASAERLKIYDEAILPQATRVAAQAETAYSKGGLTLTDLLDARRTLKTTQLEALAVRSDYAKAQGAWQLRQGAGTPR
jgi:cobalt-zinc-cadmium efflux system outer membrane protein